MIPESIPAEDDPSQQLDLKIIDLDESRNSNDGEVGFKSGGGGSGGSGCSYWVDEEADSDSSMR